MFSRFLDCFRPQDETNKIVDRKKLIKSESSGVADQKKPIRSESRSESSGVADHGYSMIMASSYIPKERKSRPLGEDAHFLCQENSTFGLADGVGGWFKKGIDSGEYARQLMNNSLMLILNQEAKGAVNLKRVLQKAFSMTKSKGSSTALIVTLKDHSLYALNVGDCGFMLYRDNQCVFRSPSQQRHFNIPYQLGNSKSSDGPSIAKEIVVPVRLGDIVVAGTDGLFDNVFEYEIEAVLRATTNDDDKSCVGELAVIIAEYASAKSCDKSFESPFSKASKLAGGKHLGGKIDDVSVIVAKII
ncbi:hypothetical protein LWI28_010224 [Acer negundo]|uniref:Protein phosphatase n=1 Tax=Acer negundo TaxID=4023 RepID=A0AAD5IIY6_ACENE|nr:hypothetical protein LWI28_010224 [Acer negundo]